MSSSSTQLRPGDVADDVHHFRFARPLAPLVDDGERRVEALGERAGAHDAADVGRHDHHVLAAVVMGLDVAHHGRGGEQIVGRNVEEALDLAGVQIDRQHPVGAGAGDEIGDELGRDRRARPGLSVLPRIAEIGDDRRDALRRGAPQRVDHDEQLHQIVVRRIGCRLDDEGVAAAHVFENFDEDLEIGEAADMAARSAARRDRRRSPRPAAGWNCRPKSSSCRTRAYSPNARPKRASSRGRGGS